jgi:hypothetical protein
LVCIDLDTPDALQLADEHLPATGMIEGRPGKLRSHRYYRVIDIPEDGMAKLDIAEGIRGPRTRQYRHADTKAMLVELKGTGAQVVCPPSKHDSGEVRAWEGGAPGEPATVTYTELLHATKRLASACGWKDKPEGKQQAQGTSQAPAGSAVAALEAELRAHNAEVNAAAAERQAAGLPPLPAATDWDVANARGYLADVEAVSGQGGHDATLRAAALLVNDHALPKEQAWEVFTAWNQTNAKPPWTEDELRHKLDDAWAKRGQDPAYPFGGKRRPEPDEDEDGLSFRSPQRLAARMPDVWRHYNETLYRYDGTRYIETTKARAKTKVRNTINKVFHAVYRWVLKQHKETEKEAASLWETYRRESATFAALPAADQKERKDEKPGKPDADEKPKKPKREEAHVGLVEEVIAELEARGETSDELTLPCMLPEGAQPPLQSLRNGLLNVVTGELLPHTPNYFCLGSAPYDYDPEADWSEQPWYLQLSELMEHDPERLNILQEAAGYALLPEHHAHICLLLTGEGSNGKGSFNAMLEAMVGKTITSHVTWQQLGGQFTLGGAIGKKGSSD